MSESNSRTTNATGQLILVVGVGRSGTSLMAGIFSRLGLHMPTPEVTADETNPRGFGEPQWVVDFHTRLLRERRMTVFDSRPQAWDLATTAAGDDDVAATLRRWLEVQFVGTQTVVVKDPRTSWFLDLWRRVTGELGVTPSYVTMLRPPAEIVASARKSYGSWQNDGSRASAWLNVMLATERDTRGLSRAYVRYADLLDDWRGQVGRITDVLDVDQLRASANQQHPDVDALIDPGLRRSARDWTDLRVPDTVRALCDTAWSKFEALAVPGSDGPSVHGGLDELHAHYVRLYGEAEAIAQSSINAAKPRKEPKKEAPAVRAQPKPPPAPARPGRPESMAVLLARAVPTRVRRVVPLRLRRRLLRG